MKKRFLLLLFLLGLPSLLQGQTVSSIKTQVTISGTGFAAGDTVTAQPSGQPCTNVLIVSSITITAACPNGTASVTVTAAAPTFPFVLKPLTPDGSAPLPTPMTFAWTVGATAPAAQTYLQADSSPCPPVPPVTVCAWPNTTIASDSSWLVVSPSSGTTAFIVTVSINTSGLTASPPTGHIIVTQKSFSTPSMSIPVTLTVTNNSSSHKVILNWQASPSATGYNVLRGTTPGGPYSTVLNSSPVTTTNFTDTKVTHASTYYYVVRAVMSNCTLCTSPNSSQASATIP